MTQAQIPRSVTYVVPENEEATVYGVLRARAELTPEAPFVNFCDEVITFEAMIERTRRFAAALAELGVERGSKVAFLLPNSLEMLAGWFAVARLGAVLVPVNTGLRGEGLRYIVEHSEANVIVVDASLIETVEAALPVGSGPSVRLVRDLDDAPRGYEPLSAVIAGSHPEPPEPDVAPADLASILYTSGTTGLPKGVMNCHNSYVTAASEFTRRYVRVRKDDVFYTSLPLFHINAQQLTTMGSILSGRPMVLAPRFSASGFIDDLRKHGATIFNYIGAMLTMIHNQPPRDEDAQSPVRLAVGGAAPTELWPDFERRFGLTILEIYGLTETATFCLGNPPDAIKVGSIGKPNGWSEVRIADQDGSTLPDGEAGEIVIRSRRPNVLFMGYHKRPEAAEEAMRDGWFRSGDRGRRDQDGYFTFIDRLKDCIRRRGENISSYEVERIVNGHPDVEECAAVGVPSELGEEEVAVVIVPRDGAELDPADVVEFCRKRMADFMIPRYVRQLSELPKTATQRVQKYALREQGVNDAWDRLAADPRE